MTATSAPNSAATGAVSTSQVGIAILGYGTVGSQVLRLMHENADAFFHRIGAEVAVRGVAVSNVEKHKGSLADELGLLTDDARALIARSDVDLVVEVIGGIDYPRELVLGALRGGKSVVTANKALVAAHSEELAQAAEESGVDLYFEAAVAAAIPVVGPLRRSLAGDQVQSVAGIVNGTTNFILDAMDSTGASYDDMLAEATRLGYAEADPTADVEGHDAASKAAILASLAFHTRVTADDVFCEGITKITADDIEAAKSAGYTIKLLAICERLKDADGNEFVSARVHPTLVPREHPLASVSKSFNAVFVEAEAAGRLMFYGNGAGGNPTASAVLGDIVGAARNKVTGGRAPGESTYANLPIASFGDVPTRYHIDLEIEDRVGVLAELAKTFAEHGVSLRTLRQEEKNGGARLIVVTHTATERELAQTVEVIAKADYVKHVNSVIRLVSE
ncbi:homoserine dehydrogenase [Corynebacterium sp. 153RC1]|uniref:homoserine dehydrogenase n=1 Tax=unclassified Corynebacterium TaxID=2624378 RepID=UPI00211C26F5|nr:MULTISPECIES: homoserine dehydrogenase [unclassified Corynebacterium]MCQ9352024.1 homoserine dehydrogenase [Corynebacterium sp. 209RC1]MCQ9353773.1 homoserine dehydrogenase [Corynebacterium sp. 1222RC1]MCQ9356243.1 homoserine dehydrogenase [Corynebacterium sp. 122RC1]MCQ9358345.1 homoserine dehydrogenase [Corynebacterium sp. 142RC1]MCQ9360920.1 homoserine dehydrogenase [Corynebacterium sp. 153RC1]